MMDATLAVALSIDIGNYCDNEFLVENKSRQSSHRDYEAGGRPGLRRVGVTVAGNRNGRFQRCRTTTLDKNISITVDIYLYECIRMRPLGIVNI